MISPEERIRRFDRSIKETSHDGIRFFYVLRINPGVVKFGLTFRGPHVRQFEGKLFNSNPCELLYVVPGSHELDQLVKARFRTLEHWIERESYRETPELHKFMSNLLRWHKAWPALR